MVPREIAQDVAKVAVDSPAYVGKLARWTRAQTGELEGLYASPIAPGRRRLPSDSRARPDTALRGRWRPLSTTLDIRTPSSTTASFALAEFGTRCGLASIPHGGSSSTREKVDDLFAYADALPDDWRAFRVARMTSLIARSSNDGESRASRHARDRRR